MSKDNERTEPVSGQPNILVSEGLLVAAGPAIAYVGAFAYETAFCRAFRIPIAFITISLTTVLIAFAALLILLLALFLLTNLGVIIGIDIRSPIGRSLVRVSIPTLILLSLMLLYGRALWRSWAWPVAIYVFFVSLEFGLPLLTQRDKKSYREKLLAQEAIEGRIDSLPSRLFRLLGPRTYWVFVGVVFAIFLLHSAGSAQARRQQEFLVVRSTPECVVLRIYGDRLICAPFNRATGEVEPIFSVIEYVHSAYEPRLQISLERVGPLSIVDP